jgi:exosortase
VKPRKGLSVSRAQGDWMRPAGAGVADSSELSRRRSVYAWAAPVLLLALLIWSYWPTLDGLLRDWRHDPNYSVGQLVPLAALYLLWHERRALAESVVRPCWWGAAVVIAAQGARAYGLIFVYESAERYSLVLTVAGIVLWVAGWRLFLRVRWILLFLLLMVPLPGKIHNAISGPLQNAAASAAVVTLELLGVTVGAEGNVLILNHRVPVAVAEACSGLRMLAAFVVVACVLAYVVNRPAWQKAALVLSSVPVAIFCNLVRLVVTAALFLVVNAEVGAKFFHEFAGLTMMPLAVLLLMGELWVMSRLVLEDKAAT